MDVQLSFLRGSRELEMDQDDVGEQEAIAELLKQISAKMKSGGLKDGL